MHHQWISRTVIAVAAVVTVVVFVAVVAAAAVAAQPGVPATFGSNGEGAGQFEVASGIAVAQQVGVDGENGNVYVVDRNNSRVDEFSGNGVFVRAWGWGVVDNAEAFETCTTATACVKGNKGSGVGQFGREAAEGVAVDNSTGFSRGAVYVGDGGNARVEKFSAEGEFELMFGGEVNATKDGTAASEAEKDVCTAEEIKLHGVECKAGVEGSKNGEFERPEHNEIAVDPQGRVYVGDASRVQRFSEDGLYEATVLSGVGAIEALAVAPNGDLYVQSSGQRGVHEYEPNGAEVSPVRDAAGEPQHAMTVDGAGNLFVDDEQGGVHHVFEYDAAGAQTEIFDRAPFTEDAGAGLAWGEAAGALYLLNHSTQNGGKIVIADVRTVSPPPPGPLVVPPVSVSPQPHQRAVVRAAIDPENAETEYFVRYGAGEPLTGASVVKKLTASFEESEVTVELSGLAFSTEYHYCLVAVNANSNGVPPCEASEQGAFVSAPATSIDAEWVEDVTGTSATLAAGVNPEETATTCRFEYGIAATYASKGSFEHVVPASAIVAPEDTDVTVTTHVQEGVQPGVEYAYRAVCEKEAVTDVGKVERFRGQSEHAEASLLDGRTLEQVATDVNGAGLVPPEEGLPQASEVGDAIAYERRAANTAGAAGNRAPEPTVDIARHHAGGGWSSMDITTPYGAATPVKTGKGSEYRLFSRDLSAAVVAPRGATPLSPSTSERTPYRRTETAPGVPSYEPLLTTMDVAEGVKFGGTGVTEEGLVQAVGADPALTHVLLTSAVALTTGSVPNSLYEWSSGSLSPVSVLPAGEGGAIVAGALGGPGQNARHAVSANGVLVYWRGGAGLYMRDMQTGESLRLDVPQAGVVPQSGEVREPMFQIASADGSRVFFTDTQRLTADATARENAPDLYECTLTTPPAGALSCSLTDVTVKAVSGGESAAVQGFVAAADEAGERVYFVARGALAPGASAGEDNLYTAVEAGGAWQVTWIATLAGEDAEDWAAAAEANVSGLAQVTERSSPDGRFFTFMSARSLTGYDNHDAVTGVPDEEVYLYDAQSGRLACMSCDPTGARPHGFFDEGKVNTASATRSPIDIEGVWVGHRLAGLLSGWQNVVLGGSGVGELTAYQPRSLSDSGRLFFDSATALVPQAANGAIGVYEFEPAGAGSCTAAASAYSTAVGGCVALISPGTAAHDSALLDASANGDDVFVMSTAGSAEGNPIYSVYDAHSCEAGTSWSCSLSMPSASAGCEATAECEGEEGAPTPALGPSPSSQIVSRSGNAKARERSIASGKGSRCRARAKRIENRKKRKRALMRCMAGNVRVARERDRSSRRRAGR